MEKKKYEPGQSVLDAQAALEAHKNKKPGAYESKWQGAADGILTQIQNRGPFSYDPGKDPLYRQTMDRYVRLGRQAMMDSAGHASALTGGYGNSYAQTVGQQSYQGYLQALSGRLPQFHQMALQQHQARGKELMDQYQLLTDREKAALGAYEKMVNNYYAQQVRLQGDYDREKDRDYDRFVDDRDYEYGVQKDAADAAARAEQAKQEQDRWQKEQDYQAGRDKIEDEQWEREFEESKRRYEQAWAEKHGGGSGGGGGGGRGSSGSSGKYHSQNSMTDREYDRSRENAQSGSHYNPHIGGNWHEPGRRPSAGHSQVHF